MLQTRKASSSSFSSSEASGKTRNIATCKEGKENNGPALENDFEKRLAICAACEKSREVVSGFPTICTECGCLIQPKAFFEHLHCPVGKW